MIDLIANAIGSMFAAGPPRHAGTSRTAGQELVWALATTGFPAADFFLVYVLGPLAALPLPFAFAIASWTLAVRVGGDRRLVGLSMLCCLCFCLAASFFGALMSQGGFFGF